jgi:4'-phosphopantetheinyl transferase
MAVGWLSRSHADVPVDDAWLGERERAALQGLKIAKRRADWRLGRFTAKAALSAWLGVPPGSVEVLAAADGAPEAWLGGAPAGVSLSLSHRAGRAVAAVAAAPTVVGCDLELVEPRSDAFVADWLAPAERAVLAGSAAGERDRLANLMWTAKEGAAKVRREGLRLDVRNAVTQLGHEEAGDGWRPLAVRWVDGAAATAGWWRAQDGFVVAIAAAPDAPPPRRL